VARQVAAAAQHLHRQGLVHGGKKHMHTCSSGQKIYYIISYTYMQGKVRAACEYANAENVRAQLPRVCVDFLQM
jgi:hypothetical protein